MTFTPKHNFIFSNTAYIQEPVAQQISWKSIQKEGRPLTNMILKSIEGSLEFHLSLLSRLFYFSFIILGLMFLAYATYALFTYHFETTLWTMLLGIPLFGIGVYQFSKQAIPLIFDKSKNLYFKNNEHSEVEDETALNKVHALQILSYRTKNENKKHAELNLVLKNGKRVYVCSYDEESYEQIEKDAQKISKYIEKPVWNRLGES